MTNAQRRTAAVSFGLPASSLIRHLLFCLCCLAFTAHAQPRPYIGYVYPAGGQQGMTFQIRLGGQNVDDVSSVLVTGSGVSAKVVECLRRLNNQEVQLLNEQLRALRRATTGVASANMTMMTSDNTMMMSASSESDAAGAGGVDFARSNLMARIEKRTREFVQTPACAAIAALTLVEVTIAPDAEPGEREIRLASPRGVSNPLVIHVGQVPEHTRRPMLTATLQVLGKEASALRKRPAEEIEERITLPCTVNGQMASGEVNRYRFEARKGQRLVISALGRQLIPFIADAVPGWFQPVLTLYDMSGKEAAYGDDYRFKPDPTIFYEVPKDGEYVFEIRDSIFRGREDFVYRITAGELPFVTSIFPLGGRVGEQAAIKMQGLNLQEAELAPPAKDTRPGIHLLAANRKGLVSNCVPFDVNTLPETTEKENNNDPAHAQKVKLPIIINGRVDKTDDWDVFQFTGKSNALVVVEVQARRLDSPLDSVIKLTDAKGTLLGFSDDYEDLCAGPNTHQADSYFMAKLPADGTYHVHLGDTARKGGEEYGYRLRISPPQPDFELRIVPSSISLRGKSTATLAVHVKRKDGLASPIKLALKDPPAGFSASPVTLNGTQAVGRLTIKCDLASTKEPVNLTVFGSAKVGEKEINREAVPAEDRMQAFLWRQLVPANDLKALAYDASYTPPPKRVVPARPTSAATTNVLAAATNSISTNAVLASSLSTTNKPQFTKQQIAGRLRQLKLLYEDALLTDEFYCEKVAECEAAQ